MRPQAIDLTWIAAVVRQARERSGKTQSEFSQFLGVSQTSVSQWERGEQMPSVESLSRILPLLGGSLDRARPDYAPMDDLLSGMIREEHAEIPRKLQPAVARAYAQGYQEALDQLRHDSSPIPVIGMIDPSGLFRPAPPETPPVPDITPLFSSFPIWKTTQPPTEALLRHETAEGLSIGSIIFCRRSSRPKVLWPRSQILYRSDPSRSFLCELRWILRRSRRNLAAVPLGDSTEIFLFDPSKVASVVVGIFGSPPTPEAE